MKNKKTKLPHYYNKLFPILIIIATMFMGIGYASINSVALNVEGKSTAKVHDGIFISNVEYYSNSNADLNNSKIISTYQTNLESSVVLSETVGTSSITYTITIYNKTSSDHIFTGIEYIVDDDTYDNTGIVCELDGLNIGDVLVSEDDVTFRLTFHYADYVLAENNILNSYINFSFKKFYTVNYINITNTNYPTVAIEGQSFEITFTDIIPTDISIGGECTYSYQAPVLTIENIASNITITVQINSSNTTEGITFIKEAYNGEENYESNGLYTDIDGSMYYAGDENVNNYVQFPNDSLLWRIISMDENDGYIKIIREYDANLSGGYDSDSNEWSESDILINLKKWYDTNLTEYSNIIIQNPTWKIYEASVSDITNSTFLSNYTDSPIGLVNIVEYVNSISGATWMAEKYQWTMTAVEGKNNSAIRINNTKYLGSNVDSPNTVYRPVIYLKASVLFDAGIGTSSQPFNISV